MHVIVVGAGLGGMTLAHALACKGHTVDLVERHVQLRPELGAAIAVSGGLAVLRSLGLEEELDQFVTPVQWLEQWLAEGMKPLSHITMKPEPAQLPPLGGKAVVLTNDGPSATGFAFARRGDLHSMLHRTLPLNVSLLLGSTVKSVNASSPLGPATVTLQDGAVLKGDVIVGADGIHSNVRKCILGENQGRVYTGIAGVYAIASKEAVLGKGSLHGSGLSADEAALLASLPVGCAREFQGNGCLGMIFHLKDDLSFVFMEQTPDPPTSDETWDHPGVRESIFASIEKHHMPSLFLKIIPHAQVAHLGLYEAEICPSWHKGRAVLLGDAAHATTPFLGQGANQAILDAYSLARHLPAAEDGTVDPAAIERAFTSYFRARAPHARAIVRASRMFGTLRLGATPLMRCARRVVLCAMGCFRGALFARFIGWATRPQV